MPEAFGRKHTESDLTCPRCKGSMAVKIVGDAEIDICTKCEATFFDVGELFAALGTSADPSYWDRDGNAKILRESGFNCPRCKGGMLLQEITQSDKKVEIDRCTKCEGLFLDKGEAEALQAIGAASMGDIAEERRKAEAELAKMEDPEFRTGFLSKFLGLFAIFGKKDKK